MIVEQKFPAYALWFSSRMTKCEYTLIYIILLIYLLIDDDDW